MQEIKNQVKEIIDNFAEIARKGRKVSAEFAEIPKDAPAPGSVQFLPIISAADSSLNEFGEIVKEIVLFAEMPLIEFES